MNGHELHSLRDVAEALGVPLRKVRTWADTGTLETLQPKRHQERLVPTTELRRFERMGYRINWDALAPSCAVGAVSGVSLDLP